MVTELSHFNLNVVFLDFDLEVFLWLARTVCYSQLNLTSDHFLSD